MEKLMVAEYLSYLAAGVKQFVNRVLGDGSIPEPMLFNPQPLVSEQPLQHQFSRIGGGLTPRDVSSIIYAADRGSIAKLIDLGNESRQKSLHLQSVLQTRENALSGIAYQVKPVDENNPTDVRTAELVRAALEFCIGDDQGLLGFEEAFPYFVAAFFYGFSVFEIMWDRRTHSTFGELIVPVGLSHIRQRRFYYSASGSMLLSQNNYAESGGVALQETYPGKFIVHRPRTTGDVPVREGLLTNLVWAALFRNWAMSDWLKLGELAWKPWRFGKYSKTAGDRDRLQLMEALNSLTTNGVALMREDQDIELLWPGGQGAVGGVSPHESLCRFMAEEMSKAVLGQTLTTEAGSRGARSLGEVHDLVRHDLSVSDATQLERTIQRQFLSWVVALNMPPETLAPVFSFGLESSMVDNQDEEEDEDEEDDK